MNAGKRGPVNQIETINRKIIKFKSKELTDPQLKELDIQINDNLQKITLICDMETIYKNLDVPNILEQTFFPLFFWSLLSKINKDFYFKQFLNFTLGFERGKEWHSTVIVNCLFQVSDLNFVLSYLTTTSITATLTNREVGDLLFRCETDLHRGDTYWYQLYLNGKSPSLRLGSLLLITDTQLLVDLSLTTQDDEICHIVVEKIHNESQLEQICFEAKSETCRMNAFSKIGHREDIAFKFAVNEPDITYRSLAFEKITSPKYLKILLLSEHDEKLLQIIKEKLRENEELN